MITNTKNYTADYASNLIRGLDITQRPWDLRQEVLSLCKTSYSLLDIGTGDAHKVIPLAKHLNHIVAMDPSAAMRNLANNAIALSKIRNITVVNGVSEKLPFPDSSFDIVTCALAPWDISEIFRVLKNGGYFVNETIGYADKLSFKLEFGSDELGLRGQLIQSKEQYLSELKNNLQTNLKLVKLQDGFWNTKYTRDGLLKLCQTTPTIRNFNESNDKLFFNNAISKLQDDDGLVNLQQNRVLLIGVKN